MFELKQAVDAEETDAGGKKKQKSKKPKGNALRLAARSLFRGESDLGPKFRKLRARRGAPKAIRRGAPKAIKGTARYLGCLVHRILTHGQAWVDRGTTNFEETNRQREINELLRKATALGLQLSPVPANA